MERLEVEFEKSLDILKVDFQNIQTRLFLKIMVGLSFRHHTLIFGHEAKAFFRSHSGKSSSLSLPWLKAS